MKNLTPEITFSLTLSNTEQLHETALGIADAATTEKIIKESVLEGRLCIKLGEDQFFIEDELIPWIQNLCLKSIPFLINGDNAVIHYFSREATLHLYNKDATLTFSDDFNDTITLALKPTLIALYHCATRFIETLSPIKKDDPAFMNAMKRLKLLKTMAEDAIELMERY